MRRPLLGSAAAGFLACTAVTSGASSPRLQIVTRSPLVVTGTHFRSAERVTVRVGATSLVVRTTRLGTFRANLGSSGGDRCSGSIVAVGARGERVVVPLRIRALCAPAAPSASIGATP
jgi:hypothetical protein